MTESVSEPAPAPHSETVTAPALEMRGITKRYPGVVANDRDRPRRAARRDPRPARRERRRQVHPDEHPVRAGHARQRRDPARRQRRSGSPARPTRSRAGISMVHQHFMLVPVMSVADNILLGAETMANAVFLDRAEAHRRIVDLGKRFGFEIDPDVKVESLSVGWQQRVEILKALYREARILVLDEPTAVLTPQETKEIFGVLRRLAAGGPQHHLHQPQAERGPRDRGPDHGHPARQGGRRARPRRDGRGRSRGADGRPRRPARRGPRREPSRRARRSIVKDLKVADDRGSARS